MFAMEDPYDYKYGELKAFDNGYAMRRWAMNQVIENAPREPYTIESWIDSLEHAEPGWKWR